MVFSLKILRGRLRLEFLTLILMVFICIFTILNFIFLFIPVVIYRCFVIALAKLFRPDLTHILEQGNQLFTLEKVTERAKTNIVVCFVLEVQITDKLEQLRSLFTSRVLDKTEQEKRQGEKGRLVYPELKQIWTSFMGYFFWKNESRFDIKEHIRICDFECSNNESKNKASGVKIEKNEICTEKDLKQITTGLLSAPWKRDFSLWEILLIPNYCDYGNHGNDNKNENDSKSAEKNPGSGNNQGKSVAIVRFHHSMGDGKSWLDILLKDLCHCADAELPQMTQREKPKWWQSFLLPIKLPYDVAKNIVESYDTSDPSKNPWHTPQKRAKKYYTSITAPISVQRIKDLKIKFGVSYAAILTTAISGGIRQVMKQAGQSVPKKMKVAMILPLPNHPGKICVHATMINLRWPIGTKDPVLRLSEIWRDMKSKKSSLFPVALHFNLKLSRFIPSFISRMVYNKNMTSMGATLFPGPKIPPIFAGCAVLDAFFFLGHVSGQLGAGVTSVAMGKTQRIAVSVDQNLFPSQEEFEALAEFIEEELQFLEYASAKSFPDKSAIKDGQNIDIV